MDVTEDKIDAGSFELIYRRYWKKIFGICLYRIGDELVAEEIVQDIFRALWERRHHFQINGSIENYLVRAAKYEILEYFRTGARRERISSEALRGFSEVDNSMEQMIHAKDLGKQIDRLIEKLPSSCREVYCCSRVLGLNNRETAEQLSISIKTVEYHLTRALRFLRSNLQEYKI